MSVNQKQSHDRELEDADEDETGAPRIYEDEMEEDERALQSFSKSDKHADGEENVQDEDIIEDIDLDDLEAMEGPDA